MSNLEMPVAAVKEGQLREKDGRSFRMNTATFLTADGDSFRLQYNANALHLRAGDTAIFGIRTGTNAKGYEYVSLAIESVRPASAIESAPARPMK